MRVSEGNLVISSHWIQNKDLFSQLAYIYRSSLNISTEFIASSVSFFRTFLKNEYRGVVEEAGFII